MNTYEKLLDQAEKEQIIVIEKYFKSKAKGLCKNNKIGISKTLAYRAEKRCILAEEMGHYFTSSGNILNQCDIRNAKQESVARRWGVKRLLKVEDLIDAFEHGVRNKHELAEHLEVTEEFLDMAVDHFGRIYGYSHSIGKHIIIFNPLCVYKNIE